MNTLATSLWVLVAAMQDNGQVRILNSGALYNHETDCRVGLIVMADSMFKDLPFSGGLYDLGLLTFECVPVEFVE